MPAVHDDRRGSNIAHISAEFVPQKLATICQNDIQYYILLKIYEAYELLRLLDVWHNVTMPYPLLKCDFVYIRMYILKYRRKVKA